MKRILPILLISLLMCFLAVGNAFSYTDITVFDDRAYGTNSWYTGVDDTRTGVKENNEVETGMQTGQVWDLEGFFLESNTFYMVGGYDFKNGYGGYAPGDIFFDIDGNIVNADGSNTGIGSINNSTFGYEYAVSFSFDNDGIMSAFLHEAGESATTLGAYYAQNDTSNPWKMGTGWNEDVRAIVSTSYDPGTNDSYFDTLFGDGTHNILSFVLPESFDFTYVHFTMECGNDNLMGKVNVPEPTTMILLGTGLIGLAGIGRRKFFKK